MKPSLYALALLLSACAGTHGADTDVTDSDTVFQTPGPDPEPDDAVKPDDAAKPDSEMPDSELPDSELPDSEMPDSELPDSEMPDSEMPDSEMPDSEMPDSELPDSASDQDDTEPATDSEPCTAMLIINEIDYDMDGSDSAEFIELYNPGPCAVSLDGLSLALVNGNDMAEYARFPLNGGTATEVAAGGYLVLAGPDAIVPAGIPVLPLPANTIQNGPDGVALLAQDRDGLMDAFCYEAPMTAVALEGRDGTFNLLSGTLAEAKDNATSVRSLARMPDGTRTGNDLTDWAITTPTPGATNLLPAP